jgi:hypothetical protein
MNPTERRKLHEFKVDIPNRKDISMSNHKTSLNLRIIARCGGEANDLKLEGQPSEG